MTDGAWVPTMSRREAWQRLRAKAARRCADGSWEIQHRTPDGAEVWVAASAAAGAVLDAMDRARVQLGL